MCVQSLVRQDVSERPRSFCFWGREGQRQMNRGGSAVRCNPMTTIEQAVCTGVRKLRACTQGFPTVTSRSTSRLSTRTRVLIGSLDPAKTLNRFRSLAKKWTESALSRVMLRWDLAEQRKIAEEQRYDQSVLCCCARLSFLWFHCRLSLHHRPTPSV